MPGIGLLQPIHLLLMLVIFLTLLIIFGGVIFIAVYTATRAARKSLTAGDTAAKVTRR